MSDMKLAFGMTLSSTGRMGLHLTFLGFDNRGLVRLVDCSGSSSDCECLMKSSRVMESPSMLPISISVHSPVQLQRVTYLDHHDVVQLSQVAAPKEIPLVQLAISCSVCVCEAPRTLHQGGCA